MGIVETIIIVAVVIFVGVLIYKSVHLIGPTEVGLVNKIVPYDQLLVEAEKMAEESTQWKQAGDRYKEILDEWRAIKGVDRKTDEALWKRFSRAREAFNRRRGSHFADLDRQRLTAKATKERAAMLPPSLKFHALRHTYASLCITAGRPIFEVARFMVRPERRIFTLAVTSTKAGARFRLTITGSWSDARYGLSWYRS